MADAKLTDMAYTKAELQAEKKEMSVGCCGSPNPYPWGLSISLESRDLDKLGITELPNVDDVMRFTIEAKVTGVNVSAHVGQEEEKRVGLQITGMALSKEST